MNNSFKRSFPFRIHFLFWLLLLGAVLTGQFIQIITLFMIIVIHELGHIMVARYYNWTIIELTLLPFGGVVKMEPASNEHPWEEFWIALAGPMINGIMILITLLLHGLGIWSWEWSLFFIQGNGMIALFNLLPIYPLDGGRMLQVFLSFYYPFRRAIVSSLIFGAGITILLLFLSIWKIELGIQLWLVLPYLFFISFLEYRQLPYRFLSFLLARHRRNLKLNYLPTRYLSVSPKSTLGAGTEEMFRHRYHLFKVESKYYGEQRVLSEIFERKRHFTTFEELD